MSHHSLFRRALRLARLSHLAERHHLEPEEVLVRARTLEPRAREWSRRDVLRLGTGLALASTLSRRELNAAPRVKPGFGSRIAILGGGLAGLAAADRLAAAGITATIYEATDRVGGRQHSLRGRFPGQVAELGGELIDNLHKTMLRYARSFGLTLEDLGKAPGEETFYFYDRHWTEAEAVAEFRVFSARAQADLRASSGSPTALVHNDADVRLDRLTLQAFLDHHAADLPLIRALLIEAYEAEYGLAASQQSALNLLLFIHLDRRSKFTPFGVFSDERYHIVEGNDAIAHGIASQLPGSIQTGAFVERLGRDPDGRCRLHLAGQRAPERVEAIICTLPFSVLRSSVTLEPSLGLSAGKRRAIAELGYGTNVKTMIGFEGRPWATFHSKGTAYADLPNVQNCWETNYSRAGATSILTDYASAGRGVALGRVPLDRAVTAFLDDLERVWPGVRAAARRDARGRYDAVRQHWPSEPTQLGSYTCYLPGQFTTLCGLEATAEGGLKFAGEHADSFYSWQGFMEGALLSGIRAAEEILADVKAGRLV